MGFLDNIRDRFSRGAQDDDYYDDDYDDDYYDDEPEAPQGKGLLGNTPRPEAESVSVYTRSGKPVSNNAGGPSGYEGQNLNDGSYAASYRREDGARPQSAYEEDTRSVRGNVSGQLPPYVLNAEAYDDVQAVVRRVQGMQPVLLNLADTPQDVATRILDFCFGLSFGIEGEVQQVGDQVFAVLPQGIQITQSDLDRLVADGSLPR
ncbi:MAG: cell division protein SepF [Atopobiaceae bacterium]|jgi:cell division inhibitor SepF